jgi:phenylacetate-CoA ligase
MYFNPTMETMPREELKKLQSERLVKMVKNVYDHVPFYTKKMDELGVKPEDIKGIEDLPKLPFTVKQDLRDNYPFNLFAVPMKDIVRVHASSGTTGKPTTVGYTKGDIDVWAELVARALHCAGADENSIVQVAYGYGLFTGGLGLHYGVEKMGGTVVPISGGNTQKQLMLMEDFGSTQLACTPSYAMYLGEALEASGKDLSDFHLKSGIFGAEPWSEHLRKKIEEKLHIKAYDIYGLSEIMGPGVAIECECQNGMHIWEDHFIAEIVDPDTFEVLPEGSEGELVITTITKEGIPLLRYRTKDISTLMTGPCPCGRTHARIARVKARTDDMLIIRGVNVFPSQIESVLLGIEGVEPHYEIIVTRDQTMDQLEIHVELCEDMSFDTISSVETLAKTIKNKIQSVLGISSTIKLVEPKSITRFEGKAKRVIDKRKENL